MENSIYIHVGLHKTGSTTLQDSFFPLLKDVEYHKTEDYLPILRRIVKTDRIYLDINAIRELFQCRLQVAKNVFSAELFTGSPLYGYINQKHILSCLKEIFDNPKIVIVLREQSDWIRSLYKHMIKHGYNGSMNNIIVKEDFVNQGIFINPHSLKYDRLVKFLFDEFGEENVLVIFYEDLKKDRINFYNSIANFIQTEFDINEVSRARSKGIGYSELFLYILRFLNFFRSSSYKKGVIRYNPKILKLIDRFFPKSSLKHFRVSDDFKNQFKYSNRNLENILGRNIPEEYIND
jgi:hypothetical protein